MKALILAGGSGTRLWPLSVQKKPKQLLTILGECSLITQTIKRLSPVAEPDDCWIVTGGEYAAEIEEHCPAVPGSQIINEPFPLGTCLAVGLGLIHIIREDPNAVVLVGWADSYIGNENAFHQAIRNAGILVDKVDGVILSVPPTYPATGYGYVEAGPAIVDLDGCYRIKRFEEKPVISRAEKFVESGDHYWNTGISIWRASKLLGLMETLVPEHFKALGEVSRELETTGDHRKIEKALAGLDKISIDHAIFEKADQMATIAADLDWSDVGSWSAVHEILATNGSNVTRGSVVGVDTDKCLIFSQKRLIATLGVSNLVIVETGDAVLIANKDDTERMKELYDEVRKFGGERYL